MNLSRRRLYSITAACLAGLTVTATACSTSADSKNTQTYKIGVLADLTGPSASLEAAGVNGFDAAVASINSAGGVAGRKITVAAPIDALSTVAGAQSAIIQVLAQRPLVIFNDASQIDSIESRLAAANTPVLSTVPLTALAGGTPKWMYQSIPNTPEVANGYVAGLKTVLGGSLSGKRIALIGFTYPAVAAYFVAITRSVEQEGGSVVSTTYTTATLASFAIQAQKIVSEKPDAVIQNDLATSSALEVSALHVAGFQGPILGGSASNDDATLEKFAALGANFEASRELAIPVAGSVMMTAAAKYGYASQASGSLYFARGWVLGYALAKGLRNCASTCSSEQIEHALNTAGPIDAGAGVAFGPLNFTVSNHVIGSAIQYFKWDPSTKSVVAGGPPVSIR